MTNKVPKYKLKAETELKDEEEKRKEERKKRTSEGIFGAIFLITLGVIFLLNNFGVLPWSVWGTLWRFWPVILILIGLQVFLGRSLPAQIFFGILMAIVLVYVVLLSISPLYPNIGEWFSSKLKFDPFGAVTTIAERNKITETLTVAFEGELQEVTERELNVFIGSSDFIISEDNSLGNHLNVDTEYYEGFNVPKLKTEISRGKLFMDFETESESRFWFQGLGGTSFDFTLGQTDIQTSINVNLGSGNGKVDLGQLNLKDLNVDIGSGSIELRLVENAAPTGKGVIDIGSGSAKVYLPENFGAEIDYDIGSGSLAVNSARLRGSGTYKTENFDIAEKTFEMEVKVGSGKVEFEEM